MCAACNRGPGVTSASFGIRSNGNMGAHTTQPAKLAGVTSQQVANPTIYIRTELTPQKLSPHNLTCPPSVASN